MSSSSKLVELDLAAFAERVAAPGPTPGSGSVAALLGTLGAGLASMACRYPSGEPSAPNDTYREGRVRELDRLRRALLDAVDRDARAYRGFLASRGDDGDDEDTARRREKAEVEVLEAPLETAELGLAALRLLALVVPDTSAKVRSECLVAAEALVAAVNGAVAVARQNLEEGLGQAEAGDRGLALAGLRDEARDLAREIAREVEGEGAGA